MHNKTFPLFQVIQSDKGGKIKEVTARMITLGEDIDAEEAAEDALDAVDKKIMLITGLSQKELDQLTIPDFNGLATWLEKQRSEETSVFLGKENPANSDPDKPVLMQSITANGGEKITQLSITVPTVSAVRMRDKQKTDDLGRAMWLVSSCTGIGIDDTKSLVLPDWLTTQVRLADFLTRPAAYFLSGTSNT